MPAVILSNRCFRKVDIQLQFGAKLFKDSIEFEGFGPHGNHYMMRGLAPEIFQSLLDNSDALACSVFEYQSLQITSMQIDLVLSVQVCPRDYSENSTSTPMQTVQTVGLLWHCSWDHKSFFNSLSSIKGIQMSCIILGWQYKSLRQIPLTSQQILSSVLSGVSGQTALFLSTSWHVPLTHVGQQYNGLD